MGYGLRWFIAEDDGTVTRVPAATCERWFDGEALPAARAGRDLKLLEVVLNVDRHHVVGVLRILPFRQGVREDGRLDVSAATRLAMRRVDLLGGETAACSLLAPRLREPTPHGGDRRPRGPLRWSLGAPRNIV
jgi:hypothetical protein